MKRRSFLQHTGMAGILAAGTAPAFAQAAPAGQVALRVELSEEPRHDLRRRRDRRQDASATSPAASSRSRCSPPARSCPGLQVADAVQNGTVECGHTAPYYYVGKDPTFAFGTAIPFGLNQRQYDAWWYFGGGEQLLQRVPQGATASRRSCAATPARRWAAGTARRSRRVADLKGLKMRIGGFAGQVLAKLGVVPQQIAGGEIYPALEKGTIDAAEWVGPYDDEKLGFNKVAKFYYYPGWWEGGPALHMLLEHDEVQRAAGGLQGRAATPAAHEGNTLDDGASTTRRIPPALRRLVAGGTQLRPFPKAVLDACYKAALELYAETSAKNAKFKKIYDNTTAFQKDQILWFRVTENTFDNFMATAGQTPRAAKKS